MVKFGGEIGGTLYQIFTPCVLKNTPCKIGQMFKRKGGGVKVLLNNVKKTALFLMDGFPKENPATDLPLSPDQLSVGDTTVILGRQRARIRPICTCRLSLIDGVLSVTKLGSSVSSADHSIPAAKCRRGILKRCALAGFPVVLRSKTLSLVY